MTVFIQDQPFDPGVLLAFFARGRSETGAIVTFSGLARADGGESTTVELESYPGFTEAEIKRVVHEAEARFRLQDVMVAHRIGQIPVGQPIVFVAVAAAHRREAFEAADFLMDYLKSRAPFWKKEHGPKGERWIEPSERDLADAERWDR